MKNSRRLAFEGIPRTENDRADYLSKVIYNDDWGISPSLLNIIESKFGHLEVDWFASEHNRKLPIFYSRFWNPSSSEIDDFSERWSDKQGLLVHSICKIIHVIRKME